jgi:hypothetical protein
MNGSNRWLAAEEYQKRVFLPRVKKVLCSIQNDLEPKLKEVEHHFVLVHPTPLTMLLRRISEEEPQFKRLVSTLTSGIDVKSMYAAGLFNAMQMKDVFSDEDCSKAYAEMCNVFNCSELTGQLQKFARDAIVSGETFGWFAVGERGGGVPFIDLDAVIVYVSPTEEWVARSADNEPLRLHFLTTPGKHLKPVSTVSIMLTRYKSMQVIRDYHMRALHYCSKPNFLTSVQGTDSRGKEGVPEVLNETLVNQATMNHHLENLIKDSVHGLKAQKRVSVQNKLHEYVSQMGNDHIDRVRSQHVLQKKMEILESQLKEIRGEVDNFKPFQYNLPDGQAVGGSYLSVRPFDIASLEEAYQREWFRVSTGIDLGSRSRSRDDNDYRREEPGQGSRLLFLPQQRYSEVIVNELLSDWAKKHEIPLEATSLKQKSWNLNEIISMREVLHPSRITFLLSQLLDLPLDQISFSACLEQQNLFYQENPTH